MPELPDVEGFRRLLERCATGQRVRSVEVIDPSVLRNTTARELSGALKGRRIDVPRRHGKWLLVRTDGPTILIHFGMTGGLMCAADPQGRHHHDRLVLVMERGEVRYRDQRKLQGIWLARDDAEAEGVMGRLGPDALGLSRRELEALLAGRRGALKAVLMDQHVVAGLGNLLTDEILWRARLHPSREAGGLDRAETGRLYRAMKGVLEASVEEGRVPARARWLTGVRGDAEPICPRCRTPLRRSRVAGRTSWWCPRCQPELS
jgi:formamidopyrimidine-DNA glycosylase